ncbi:MAG: sugar transferase [Lachnospiraceae bacterium]|nr:sugar transferase [Lachnospiraceae bacterium]
MNSIYRKSRVVTTYSLILIDLLVVVASYCLALLIRFHSFSTVDNESTHLIFGILLVALSLLYSIGTDWNRDFFIRGYYREFIADLKHVMVISLSGVVILYLGKQISVMNRLVVGVFMLLELVMMYAVHLGFKNFMLAIYKKSINSDKLMVVTTSDRARKVIEQINAHKDWNYELTCAAIIDKDMKGSMIDGIEVVADSAGLIDYATQSMLDRVFISLPIERISEVRDMILEFEAMGMLCHYDIEMEELGLEGKEAGSFAGFSVLSFSLQNMDYRRLLIKRFIDIIGSIFGMLITVILFIFVAPAIKLESKGPVIFKQERIGKNGRRFMIYKFRSMYMDAEKRLDELKAKNEMKGLMFKMEDDPRITKVGRFLRKTSIDEFPQFFNVFKGDMSLVGTRPPTVSEFEQYNVHYRRRLSITPGLTGLWQVSGRSDITDFDEVVKLDLEYIDHWSLSLDAKLLIQTVGVVLFRKGSK